MNEENTGLGNSDSMNTNEPAPLRPKRGRPPKLDADGNPVRRGRPPKKKPEDVPAGTEQVRPQETPPPQTSAPAAHEHESVEQRELDFVPIPVPGQPDLEYVPAAPPQVREHPVNREALMPPDEYLDDDPRERRDNRNNRNSSRQFNNNRRGKFPRNRDNGDRQNGGNHHNNQRREPDEADLQIAEDAVPSLNISELQEKSMQELTAMGEALGIEGIGALEKSTLIFEILRANAEKSGLMYGSGYLEVLPDGFGFLRSPSYSY
ncbi:MAG: Rho termination factor N-terminal domain-containing protein, partial [Lentisphaeria bacterium]|nr:Rho termination factor N-terminal domain-containing protein [Lentisphaeria bacterium]